MNELIEKFEPQRAAIAKVCKILIGIGIALLIGGLILMVVTPIVSDGIGGAIAGFVLIGVSIIIFVVAGIKESKAKKTIGKEIITYLMNMTYQDVYYDASKGISESEFEIPHFFVSPDRYMSSNYFQAKYGTTSFHMSDYHLERLTTTYDGKNTRVHYETYAEGRFFVFDFERDFKNTVKVVEKSMLSYGKSSNLFSGLKKVELESIEFNKKFQTLSNDQVTAFYILTPQVQEQMMNLEKAFKGQIFFMFDKHYLYIAVDDRKSSFGFSVFKKLSEESLKKILAEVSIPKNFVEALKLNREKYNRDSTTKEI